MFHISYSVGALFCILVEEMSDTAQKLKDILQCEVKTAESIEKQLKQAGIENISNIEKESTDIYTILKISTNDVKSYYVFLGDGFFLEEIREESVDGKVIYQAIE